MELNSTVLMRLSNRRSMKVKKLEAAGYPPQILTLLGKKRRVTSMAITRTKRNRGSVATMNEALYFASIGSRAYP